VVSGAEVFLAKGHYRIVRPADESSPERCLAEDLDAGGLVTLVSLECSELGRAGVERFLHRAAGVAALANASPAVPRVRGSGRDDDRVFLVVEEPRGRRLDDVLAGGQPLEIERALGITLRVAEVLEAAHNLGVTHGTLTPAVVTVDDADDAVVVSGFEIAIVWEALAPPPRESRLEGVEASQAAERADVQALGGFLYHLVTGVPPASPGFVPARKSRRDVSPDLDLLITEMLGQAGSEVPDLSSVLNDLYAAGRRPDAPSAVRRVARQALVVGPAAILVGIGVLVALGLVPTSRGRVPVVPPSTPAASLAIRPAGGPGPQDVRVEPAAAPPITAAPAPPAASVPEPPAPASRGVAPADRAPASSGSPAGAAGAPGKGRPSGEPPAPAPAAKSPPPKPAAAPPVAPPANAGSEASGAPPPRARTGDSDADDPGAVIDWLIRSRAGGG
jgi:hypothetical protein